MIARGPIFGIILGIATVLAAAYMKPAVRIVYNPSDSAPRGWYLVRPASRLSVGEYVVARLPSETAAFAATRGYLPRSVPILKQIAAIGGQRVCIRNGVVYVDGAALARTLDRDGKNRSLTAWRRCQMLGADELFLLNVTNPGSFDSRYFGPLDTSFVRGRAIPLMTEEVQ
jgi:conjugative transfer signal peptidase TraF